MLCKVPNFLGKSTFEHKTNKPATPFPSTDLGTRKLLGTGEAPRTRKAKPRNSREVAPAPISSRFLCSLPLHSSAPLARPTETAMLRWLIRWLHCRRHLRPKLRIARKCDGVFKKTEPQQTLNSLFSCLGSSVKDT